MTKALFEGLPGAVPIYLRVSPALVELHMETNLQVNLPSLSGHYPSNNMTLTGPAVSIMYVISSGGSQNGMKDSFMIACGYEISLRQFNWGKIMFKLINMDLEGQRSFKALGI